MAPVITGKDIALAAEAINRISGLSPVARRVGLELINHANRDPDADNPVGTAWPSEARLANILGVTDRAIRKAKTQLAAKGLVSWQQRGRHPQRTPLYELAWDRLKALAAIIKERVAKATKPYRKPLQLSLGRNTRSGYLTQFKNIGFKVAGKAIQPQNKSTAVDPIILNKQAHSRLWADLMALPELHCAQVLERITETIETQAVKAERFKPKSGLTTLLNLIKQENTA